MMSKGFIAEIEQMRGAIDQYPGIARKEEEESEALIR